MPTSSVPRPRWLCVAIGTSSRIRSMSVGAYPASASRSAARPATSPCAHGQALIPVASTPTTRFDPVLGRRGDPDQRDHLLRREARDRRRPSHRPAGGDAHLGPDGALALARCCARSSPRSPRRSALRRGRRRRSPRRTPPGTATCARPSGRGAGRRCIRSRQPSPSRHHLAGCGSPSARRSRPRARGRARREARMPACPTTR